MLVFEGIIISVIVIDGFNLNVVRKQRVQTSRKCSSTKTISNAMRDDSFFDVEICAGLFDKL